MLENTTKKEVEQRKFEFILHLNDNIIVQRFFNINGFNSDAVNSLTFKEVIDDCQETIHTHLKNKTMHYYYENENEFTENPDFELSQADDKIKFSIKMDGAVITYREWSAKIYPVKVRYTIDIRPYIYEIISSIQKCLSRRNDGLDFKYLQYNLMTTEG